MKSGLNQYFEEVLLSPTKNVAIPKTKDKLKVTRSNSYKITLSQYFEKELLEETTAAERMQEMSEQPDSIYDQGSNNEDEEIDIYTSYASYMSSSDPGSDNLLVTFDYGFQDSLDADHSWDSQVLEILDNDEDSDLNKNLFKIPEEESSEDLLMAKHAEQYSKSPSLFKVHQVEHLKSTTNINTRASSCTSMATSTVEYNIDTSGDYGSWAQSESEQEEEGDITAKTYRNYRYEDLIKNEVLIYDDDDDNDITNGDDGREVLINFDFDEELPPRWFTTNEQLYYRSVDYLN